MIGRIPLRSARERLARTGVPSISRAARLNLVINGRRLIAAGDIDSGFQCIRNGLGRSPIADQIELSGTIKRLCSNRSVDIALVSKEFERLLARSRESPVSGDDARDSMFIVSVLEALGAYRAAESLRTRLRSHLIQESDRREQGKRRGPLAGLQMCAHLDAGLIRGAMSVAEDSVRSVGGDPYLAAAARQLALINPEFTLGSYNQWLTRRAPLSQIVEGRRVLLRGPSPSMERRSVVSNRDVEVWTKFLGIERADGATRAASPDVSYLNSGALSELSRRFASNPSTARFTWGRCRLLCLKGGAIARADIPGIKTRRVDSRQATWFPQRLIGITALVECIGAGAKSVHVTGIDLHLSAVTHASSYPLFEAPRVLGAGLSSVEVCLTHAQSDPFSQLSLLANLHRVGRISMGGRLEPYLTQEQVDFASALERVHGITSWLESGMDKPFARS